MKALLSLVVLFASAGAYAQDRVPAPTSQEFQYWTTYYYPRAAGLPIRYESEGFLGLKGKSSSLDGVCKSQGKTHGANDDKDSIGTEKFRVEFVAEVDRKGHASSGPITRDPKNGEIEKSSILTQVTCYKVKKSKRK